jgi:hypothetical protein
LPAVVVKSRRQQLPFPIPSESDRRRSLCS